MQGGRNFRCPVCNRTIVMDKFAGIGSTVVCDDCDTMLRIVEVDPPEVEIEAVAGLDDKLDDDAQDLDSTEEEFDSESDGDLKDE